MCHTRAKRRRPLARSRARVFRRRPKAEEGATKPPAEFLLGPHPPRGVPPCLWLMSAGKGAKPDHDASRLSPSRVNALEESPEILAPHNRLATSQTQISAWRGDRGGGGSSMNPAEDRRQADVPSAIARYQRVLPLAPFRAKSKDGKQIHSVHTFAGPTVERECKTAAPTRACYWQRSRCVKLHARDALAQSFHSRNMLAPSPSDRRRVEDDGDMYGRRACAALARG